MEKFKAFVPYIIIMAVAYYIVPFIPTVFPSVKESFGISLLVSLIIPLSCLISAFVFGLKNGMSFVYVFIMLILYVPQVIYYKSPSVAIVGFIYLIFSFIGMYTGANLGRTIKSRGKKDNNN